MPIEIDPVTGFVSLLALVVSIINWRNGKKTDRSNLFLARYMGMESNLGEWHDAYKFYGIDIEEAKANGVTTDMLSYFILYIIALQAKCKATGNDVYTEINSHEFRKRFFLNEHTISTWPYVKLVFSGEIIEAVDKFIADQTPLDDSQGG